MAYRVLLADDRRMVRMLLESIIEKAENYILVSSCVNSRDALSACRGNHVDLVLMDVLFPDGVSGIDAA